MEYQRRPLCLTYPHRLFFSLAGRHQARVNGRLFFGLVDELRVDQTVRSGIKRATLATNNLAFDGIASDENLGALGDAVPTFEDQHGLARDALL